METNGFLALLGALALVTATGAVGPPTASDLSEEETRPADVDATRHVSGFGASLLEAPVDAREAADSLADVLVEASGDGLAPVLALGLERLHDRGTSIALGEPDDLRTELERSWRMHGDTTQARGDDASPEQLPDRVERALAWLVLGARTAEEIRPDVVGAIGDQQLALLLQDAVFAPPADGESEPDSLLEGAGGPTHLQAHEAALEDVDVQKVMAAHLVMAQAVDQARWLLQASSLEELSTAASSPGDVYNTSTPYGTIVVSGSGDHTYTEEAFVTVDLGGDDRYENRPGATTADVLGLLGTSFPPLPPYPGFVFEGGDAGQIVTNASGWATDTIAWTDPASDWANDTRERIHRSHNVSVSIDLEGEDVYAGTHVGTQGFGSFGGFGALVDVLGDDTYTADALAQGTGLVAGAGFLLDAAGQNTFDATQQAQGYSQDAGAGWLISGEGADAYTAEIVAQGTGFVLGLAGGLVDAAGQDDYLCSGTADFSDVVIPVTASRPGSVCQGTGYGGAGILVDDTGNDTYETASSFRAMALLGTGVHVDGAGHDTVTSGEWSNGVGALGASVFLAQGSGDNTITADEVEGPWIDIYVGFNGEGYFGVGILGTGSGDDLVLGDVDKNLYLVQYACGSGCGYADGVGLAHSTGGDDRYRTEVGQGAGINASGLLINEGGNDTYETLHDRNRTQGYAEGELLAHNPCVTGVLHDAGGDDSYDNPVTDFGTRDDGETWGQNQYGRGLDDANGTQAYAYERLASDLDDARQRCDQYTGLQPTP